MKARWSLLIALCLLILSISSIVVYGQTSVGAGSYTTSLPAGGAGPQPATPYITSNITGAVPTTDWWSSLVWKVYPHHSERMYPHPLMLQAYERGLTVGYTATPFPSADGRKYEYTFAPSGQPFNGALTVGIDGMNLPYDAVRLHDYSDWTVTADFGGQMQATFGHGMPFIYLRKTTSAQASIIFYTPPTIHSNSNGSVHVTVNGQTYGIFAPSGSSWTLAGDGVTLRSSLAGKDYFSLAILPDSATSTFNDYRNHAFAFITDTQVNWQYNAITGTVNTTYSMSVDLKEGTENRPLIALYRHQWLNSSNVNTAYTYASPRGTMQVMRGTSFTTSLPFNGVLPYLPNNGTYNTAQLYAYVDEIYNLPSVDARLHLPGPEGGYDTYWTGKGLGRIAMLIPIAEQVGHTAARDRFLSDIKSRLEDWYTASAGEGANDFLFYRNNAWGTLIGYPASYGSDSSLNDHHFHYGYYIMAAAIVSMYDPNWAAQNQWGAMTEELIRDSANWDRNDTTYPFLRSFDPYAGHAWASGSSPFAAGNNQESSSESMNFAAALILWGSSTGNTAIRDLGIYLYATEAVSIEQYWFDVDSAVFPSNYNYDYSAMVWSDGASHTIWWNGQTEEVYGINYLPLTGGSLYLGRNTNNIINQYNNMVASNAGAPPDMWADIHWQTLAMANPSQAISLFGTGNYTPEWGETRAHTYHWIHNFNALGSLEPSVHGNSPTSAVFNKNATLTYVAYNPSYSPVTVSFSNGYQLAVPARQMASSQGGTTNPTITPSPTLVNSVTPNPNTPTFTPSFTPSSTATVSTPTGNSLYLIDGGSLSFAAGGGASSDSISSAGGANYDGTPHNPTSYMLTGISGTYAGGTSQFNLFLDAGTGVGNGTQARISYDWTGDGSFDRVETYAYFATDPVVSWEQYTQAQGLIAQSGNYSNLSNGRVKIEIWNAIGNGSSEVRTSATSGQGSQSRLTLPFSNLSIGNPPATATFTPSFTATATHTASPTFTPTFTNTPTATFTPTLTFTPTPNNQAVGNMLYLINGTSLSFWAGSGATNNLISSAGGANYDGTPHNPLVYTVSAVTGTYAGGNSQFSLYLDAGTTVANGSQARISYDWNGDGNFDRVETYAYFATDPVVGWENYNQSRGLISATGNYANLNNGTIRLEVWNAIGNGTTNLRTSATSGEGLQSSITLPFSALTIP